MKTLVLALVLSMVAGAQTEVRHAIVLPSYKDLKYPPLPPLKVPDPTEITLSNGMKVLLLENHELPLISGAALIRPARKASRASPAKSCVRVALRPDPAINSIRISRMSPHPLKARSARPTGRCLSPA